MLGVCMCVCDVCVCDVCVCMYMYSYIHGSVYGHAYKNVCTFECMYIMCMRMDVLNMVYNILYSTQTDAF